MIFYYSATGNTRYCAEYIAKSLGEKAVDLLQCNPDKTDVDREDSVGFMFPIYCWGVPPVVSRFIEAISAKIPLDSYLWAACTCGDEAGMAMRRLGEHLALKRGKEPDALFSIIMPNTYVLLPGFDVDKPLVRDEKLKLAPLRLNAVARIIEARRTEVFDVKEGSVPVLRSALFPVFEKWGVFPRRWKVSDACIGCGKCAGVCPAKNIKMTRTKPEWGKTCYSCCACFHICPQRAINYGKATRNKSQYFCNLS